MPRGDNPKSRANLKPCGSPIEARKRGKLGGIASGETRRSLRSLAELDRELTTEEERALMIEAIKRRAMQGNIKAFEVYRDTMGMKPTEKNQVSVQNIPDFELCVERLQNAIAERRKERKEEV